MVMLIDSLKNYRKVLSATLEVTYKCNFKCDYCFQKSLRKSYRKEIGLCAWKKILDMLADNGCIRLMITGGEICVKRNIDKIYEYANNKGFIVDLASNCFNITKVPLLESIIKYKPNRFLVTLYGDNDVYSDFCSVKHGWDIIKENIITLIESGINVHVRCVFHKNNFSSINKIEKFVKKYNIPTNIYTTIISDCDCKTKYDKISLEIDKILKIYKKFNKLGDIENLLISPKKNKIVCGAGKNSLYINPYGYTYLCPSLINISKTFNILDLGFDLCWKLLYYERKKYIEKETPCINCENMNFCYKCYPNYYKEYSCNKKLLKNIACNKTSFIKNKIFSHYEN